MTAASTTNPSMPAAFKPIRVVVVDDSPFVCRLLTSYLHSTPDLKVVGTALRGDRAIELVKELSPDAVTLDLEMPGVSGIEALEQIMRNCPTPVIVLSGVSCHAATTTLRALELGAVDFILKYMPGIDTNPEALQEEIVGKVRAASQIKVVRLLKPFDDKPFDEAEGPLPPLSSRGPRVPVAAADDASRFAPFRQLPGVVVIGASTGGPLALRQLLAELPVDFKSPVIVVQHMPDTFTGVLAEQLGRHVALQVREARDGDRLAPGEVLVAPGDHHLLLRPGARVELSRGPKIKGHRPSIDVTMQSVTQLYGSRTTGVILTCMGDDGTIGMAFIRAKAGRTFAQDAESCVVNGMPQRAVEKGVVDAIATPAQIGRLLRGADSLNRTLKSSDNASLQLSGRGRT